MSRRRPATGIRGPQSALTDFLASNNISAAQIRDEYEQRQRQAQQQAQQETQQDGASEKENEIEKRVETAEETKKRKRKEIAAIARIKESKEFKKLKGQMENEPDDDDDYIAKQMLDRKKHIPTPGQLDYCEICEKRFTVTPYSKNGPEGGLLCGPCSKKVRDQEKKDNKPQTKGISRQKKRQQQSNLLDGIAESGTKSLVEICVEKVADNIHDIEEFGDLPPTLLTRLSQILSKRRVMTRRTLDLFLKADSDAIDIYDCAKLDDDDFQKIFSVMPGLEHVNLRNAGQIKDDLFDYIIERDVPVKHLELVGANLVSDDGWKKFFDHYGRRLQVIKLAWLDSAFDDESMAHLVSKCINLERLKLKKCFKLGDDSLQSIGKLGKLEHLSLSLNQETEEMSLVYVIDKTGSKLRTLSLEDFHQATDGFLEVIKQRCSKLRKLRFTNNDVATDSGIVNLFTGWKNPPLHSVDLSNARDMDNSDPDGGDDPIGLASEGLKAMMRHSGSEIRQLDISSCRHISYDALSNVFDGEKIYPKLTNLNISFLTNIDNFIVGNIIRSCPKIAKLTAFACFQVKDVPVPVGVALIGVPNAQDRIVVEGTSKAEVGDLL